MKRQIQTIAFVLLLLISQLSISQFISPVKAPTETRYMRGNQHTINGLTAYVLGTTQSSTQQYTWYWTYDNIDASLGIRVWKRASGGTETEITAGSPVAIQTWYDDYGLKSANWNCPQTNLTITDAIVVRVYYRWGSGDWTLSYSFITEQLSATQLYSETWSVTYYGSHGWDPEEWVSSFAFYFGTSGYNSRIDNFSRSTGDITPPTYSDVGTSTLVAGKSCVFHAKWTDNENMSGYIFGTNNTGTWINETWTTLSSNPAWTNVTKTLNSTIGLRIQWCVWANDTNNNWNNTGTQTFPTWEEVPYVFETNFGLTGGATSSNIFYNATATGGKLATYVTYQNSSFTPWKYQVRAFDAMARTWTEVQTIGNCEENDPHWSPTISVLPDGRLILLHGHSTENIKYRISTNNASTETNLTKLVSEWSDQLSFTVVPYASYPRALRWSDELVVFYNTGGPSKGNWSFSRWNATSQTFGEQTKLIYFGEVSLYASFGINGNNILCSFNRYTIATVSFENLYFIYSPDKGYTWKNITGSTLSLPIYGPDVLVASSSHRTEVGVALPPFLDENGKVVIPCYRLTTVYPQNVLGEWWIMLCQYSASLGQSGSWTLSNVTDENGVQIFGQGVVYMNLYYNRPCFFTSNPYGNKKVSAYVRYPFETTKFKLVWEDDKTYILSSSHYIRFGYRLEACLAETAYNLLGFPEVGVSSNDTMMGLIYGTNFTAQETTKLVGVKMYVYSPPYMSWKAAIYNSTFHRIAVTGSGLYTTGTTDTGWLLSVTFPDLPTITEGQNYWFCFMAYEGTKHYYNASTLINQTFTCASSWTAGFPETLSPTTYYNRTISIAAFRTDLVIRGVGDVIPLQLNVGWNNFTVAWSWDLDKTLEQVCANIQANGVDSVIVIKYNTTYYRYDYGYDANASVKVLSVADELQIYCNTAGTWFRDYSLFAYKKIVTESLAVATYASRIKEILRTASNSFSTTFYASRLIDVTRIVTLSLSPIFSGFVGFFVNVALVIASLFGASRISEFDRSVTQVLTFTFSATRLQEIARIVTQDIIVQTQVTVETLISFFRTVAITITTSLTVSRLIETTRTATQTLAMGLNAEKLAEATRNVAQTLVIAVQTGRTLDLTRTVLQTFTTQTSALRLIEITRVVTQTFQTSFQSAWQIAGQYFVNVALSITTALATQAEWLVHPDNYLTTETLFFFFFIMFIIFLSLWLIKQHD